MSDVFVSYKAEDRKRVKLLVEALEGAGYSIWWDEQIGGGAAWRRAIETELNAAKCVIVAWSKRSVGPDGAFVHDEAARAQQRHVYVPVLIDKVHLPLGFGETQALSLCGWRGDQSAPQYQAILNAVRGIVGEAPSRPAIAASATPKVSRRTVVGGSAAAAAAAAAAGWYFFRGAPAEASNSIAVMPFANLSGDPSQAYFSDGLAEELRSALARIPELNVMARTSSEKVREDDIKTAAHKLGVANILIGSVRRSPSTIRVSTQLVDGHDGLERWSEAYDRPIGDTLNIQTDIAEKVAAALSVRLSSDPRTVLEAGGTTNPAAQDLLLQVDRDLAFNKEGLERRIAILDGALALDPNYAQAYARKASLLMVNAGTFASSANESYRGHIDALEVANKAIGIAPKMAAGYAVRGNIYRQLLNMRAAWADAARANTLPGKDDVEVLELESVLESQIGRSGEAERIVSKWIALDPLNPQAHAYQGVIRYNARRYPAAVESLQHSLAIAPNSDRARAFLGYALMAQGKTADAGIEFRKLKPDDYRRLLGQAVLAARAGRRLEALQNLQSMQHTLGDAGLFQYASIYAQLGMADEAFRDLQRAVSVRDSGASGIRTDPFLDPLRRDPRFAELERKIDFP
jgi:TolB-like protein/tetratricopeptide (TPR) repeat protein